MRSGVFRRPVAHGCPADANIEETSSCYFVRRRILFHACGALNASLDFPLCLRKDPLQRPWFMQPEDVQGSRTPYGDNVIAARSVQAGDARIYYEVYGEGRPVFVFHGGGVGSPYEFGEIIDELRESRRVVVVSSHGHGRSELGRRPSPCSVRRLLSSGSGAQSLLLPVFLRPAIPADGTPVGYSCASRASTSSSRVAQLVAMRITVLPSAPFSQKAMSAMRSRRARSSGESSTKIWLVGEG